MNVWLWHKRLCHVNFDNLIDINKMMKLIGLPRLKKHENTMYKQCHLGKMSRSSFKSKNHASSEILELVHIDLCGPITPQSYYGARYCILFVDDYSRMMVVMYLKEKFEAFKMFKWYLARVEKEIGKSPKCLRSNRGGEFVSHEFELFFNDRGIKRKSSTTRTPPQNGVAKRRNRSILDCPRVLMMEKNVALKY